MYIDLDDMYVTVTFTYDLDFSFQGHAVPLVNLHICSWYRLNVYYVYLNSLYNI